MPRSTRNGACSSGSTQSCHSSQCAVGVTRIEALPANARAYLARIEALAGIPIDLISTGADRDHTIVLRHPFG